MNKEVDRIVSQYFDDHGYECRWHIPSLADHIGFTSTLGHPNRRKMRGLGFQPDATPIRSHKIKTSRMPSKVSEPFRLN